jgi:hypothetical protein
MKNQKIFLKLCEPCRKVPGMMSENWADLCDECRAKIMQCVRLLISSNLQPAAVVVEMTEMPSRKELDRTSRTDLLLLIEELRGLTCGTTS